MMTCHIFLFDFTVFSKFFNVIFIDILLFPVLVLDIFHLLKFFLEFNHVFLSESEYFGSFILLVTIAMRTADLYQTNYLLEIEVHRWW